MICSVSASHPVEPSGTAGNTDWLECWMGDCHSAAHGCCSALHGCHIAAHGCHGAAHGCHSAANGCADLVPL